MRFLNYKVYRKQAYRIGTSVQKTGLKYNQKSNDSGKEWD